MPQPRCIVPSDLRVLAHREKRQRRHIEGFRSDPEWQRETAPDRILALLDRIARLERQLRLAAGQFEYYGRLHTEKGTPEALQKAEINRAFAKQCRETVGNSEIPVAES